MENKKSAEYTIDGEHGVIRPARQCPSPNQDARPADADLSLIVLHNISLPPGDYSGDAIEQFFSNTLDFGSHPYFAEINDLKVSTHLLIRRDGTVLQFVPFHRRAWHAGDSQFQGRSCCNDHSIGIEIEGVDDQPYESPQYHALTGVVDALVRYYPALNMRRIAGHCDIAPGRKTDPGPAFDWFRLYDGVVRQRPEGL